MNNEQLNKLNQIARENSAILHEKIKEVFKDLPPYTEEELTKKPEKWLANERLRIQLRIEREIKEAGLQ